jgi:hypothetical protein
MTTHIDEFPTEGSDYQLQALLVGPDGVTPIDPGVVTEILMTLRDVASATLIVTDQNVTSALGAVVGGFNFRLDMLAAWMREYGTDEEQLRVATFKITHSAGKKRNQEVSFYVDQLTDVDTTP